MSAPAVEPIRTASFTIPREGYARALMPAVFTPYGVGALVFVVLVAIYTGISRGTARGLFTVAIGLSIFTGYTLRDLAKARRTVNRPGTLYDVPRSFEFSDAGIGIRMEGRRDSLLDWTKVRRVVRRNGFVLLMLDPPRHYPVPEDAFRSHEDLRALLEMASRRGLPVRRF